MEDENTKEENQPSTSKKESQRTNSGNDLYDERGRDDRPSSATSMSATYSLRSRIDMADARPEIPKPPLGKREVKAPERKKRGRRNGGRVEKRRRSFTRRQVRRVPKRKLRPRDERKDRDLSVSTIFTRLSSRSGSRTPGCIHCGHRCCRRRIFPPDDTVGMSLGSKQTQMGSRSLMLSPLFVTTNSTPEEVPPDIQTYAEITPEMIHGALQRLTRWKQYVQTKVIVDYIKNSCTSKGVSLRTILIPKHLIYKLAIGSPPITDLNQRRNRVYPVNKDESQLFYEMKEKLRIAAMVGMVVHTSDDSWCLSCSLQKRKLTANHVSLFWQAFADTLSPIYKKPVEEKDKERIDSPTNTAPRKIRANDKSLRICDYFKMADV